MRFWIIVVLVLVHSGETANAGKLEEKTSRLLRQLKTAKGKKHLQILYKLAEIGPEAREAIPVLVALLSDDRKYPTKDYPEETRSGTAVYVLSTIGVEAIPTVKKLLRHRDPKMRFLAIDIITDDDSLVFFRPDVQKILLSMLKEKNVKVGRFSLHFAILRTFLGPRMSQPVIPVELVPFLTQCLMRDKEYLARMNLITEASLASAAARNLSELGPKAKAALPALARAAIKHPDPNVRECSMIALGRIDVKGEFAIPALTQGLADEGTTGGGMFYSGVNSTAAEELLRFTPRASSAVPAILKLLKDEKLRVSYYSELVSILARIRPVPKAAILSLRRDMQPPGKGAKKQFTTRHKTMLRVLRRVYAAGALAQMTSKNKDAIALLISVAEDRQWSTKPPTFGFFGQNISPAKEAIDCLAKLGPKAQSAIPALQRLLKKDKKLASALFLIDPNFTVSESQAELVVDRLDSLPVQQIVELLSTRAKACIQVIVERPGFDSSQPNEFWIAVLKQVKPNPLPALAKIAAEQGRDEVLKQIGKHAIPVIPVLIKELNSKYFEIRADTARILGQLKFQPKIVVPALVRSLNDERVIVRYRAAVALGEFGPQAKAAQKALKLATKDNYHSVRSAARVALAKIQQRKKS